MKKQIKTFIWKYEECRTAKQLCKRRKWQIEYYPNATFGSWFA
jgi:hypothetical protein